MQAMKASISEGVAQDESSWHPSERTNDYGSDTTNNQPFQEYEDTYVVSALEAPVFFFAGIVVALDVQVELSKR
jgi:hypothetical protein